MNESVNQSIRRLVPPKIQKWYTAGRSSTLPTLLPLPTSTTTGIFWGSHGNDSQPAGGAARGGWWPGFGVLQRSILFSYFAFGLYLLFPLFFPGRRAHSSLISLLTVLVMALGALHLFLSARCHTIGKKKRFPSAASASHHPLAAKRKRLHAAWHWARLEGKGTACDHNDGVSTKIQKVLPLPDHHLLALLSSSSSSSCPFCAHLLALPTTVLPHTPSVPPISPSCFGEVQSIDTVDSIWAWGKVEGGKYLPPNSTYPPPSYYTLPLSKPLSYSPSFPSSSSFSSICSSSSFSPFSSSFSSSSSSSSSVPLSASAFISGEGRPAWRRKWEGGQERQEPVVGLP